MKIQRCSELSPQIIYDTFMDGFQDYPIKIPMTEEQFLGHFFGPEGNSLEHSFLAMDGEKGVGLILGGIRELGGIKSMRCGTLCITPSLRGTGVANQLLSAHQTEAKDQGCKQLCLEVLAQNERAIRFYQKNGYQSCYELSYYSLGELTKKSDINLSDYEITEIPVTALKEFRNAECKGLYINWQNEYASIEKREALHLGVKRDQTLLGGMSVRNGNIQFLFVTKDHRGKGLGTELLERAFATGQAGIHISFSNNAMLTLFCHAVGMKKDDVYQYEMFRLI